MLFPKAHKGVVIQEGRLGKWRYDQLPRKDNDSLSDNILQNKLSRPSTYTMRSVELQGPRRPELCPPEVSSFEEWIVPLQDPNIILLALRGIVCRTSPFPKPAKHHPTVNKLVLPPPPFTGGCVVGVGGLALQRKYVSL